MQALIVGAGSGFSASLARRLSRAGYAVALAARDTQKLAGLVAATGVTTHACDAADPAQVAALFETKQAQEAEVVLYNASFRTRGPITELDPADVRRTLEVCAFGAFLVAQQAARLMIPRGRGTILLTGASAGVKGYPRSAPFAMGKFALRGLGEALARELHPQGVHVVHIVVDGGIRSARRVDPGDDSLLDPDAIAEAAFAAIAQPRSAWSHEIAVRPWVETF